MPDQEDKSVWVKIRDAFNAGDQGNQDTYADQLEKYKKKKKKKKMEGEIAASPAQRAIQNSDSDEYGND